VLGEISYSDLGSVGCSILNKYHICTCNAALNINKLILTVTLFINTSHLYLQPHFNKKKDVQLYKIALHFAKRIKTGIKLKSLAENCKDCAIIFSIGMTVSLILDQENCLKMRLLGGRCKCNIHSG